MANRSIPELTENTSPGSTDLIYLAMKSPQGLYYDRHCLMGVFKKYVVIDKTTKKASSYLVTNDDCDKRWISNQGSIATVVYTLPTAAEGLEVGFVVEEPFDLEIQVMPGDKISQTYTAATSSSIGSALYFKGSSGYWVIVSQVGTWSIS